MKSIRHAGDVARWHLCVGCGACASVCPEHKIALTEVIAEGFRPVVDAADCGSCRTCLDVCPAWHNDHTALHQRPGIRPELASACGPVLELWEGHATNRGVRLKGASGGILTALSCFALEHEHLHGVLHVGADPDEPTRNRTVFSRTAAEVIARTGSRYAAASTCDRLDIIANAPGPCVFIGQPSEVTALRKVQRLRPGVDRNIGLVLSFFCAGSPARLGTLRLLESLGVAPAEIRALRYRGEGWPGDFIVEFKSPARPPHRMSYADSWKFVQAFRPFATHLTPDGTGEDADISCGDAWHRAGEPGNPGTSLILVRTETGRAFLHRAEAAGIVALNAIPAASLFKSQRHLIAKRGAVAGRVFALRLLGLPAPRLRGFDLWSNWRLLSWRQRVRSVFGTIRRIIARGYLRPDTNLPAPAR